MEYDWEKIGLILVVLIVTASFIFGMTYLLCSSNDALSLNSALQGCLKCEYNATNGNYYLFTCSNSSYKISEEQYLKLKFTSNLSECR
jgi:hypothetical protein